MARPVYTQIVEDIKNKINSGRLKPGDAIDSENTLCKEYGASRMTVRKGLAILANEGYIYSIPGKGNFVSKPDFTKYTLYYNEMNNPINTVDRAKLLEVNIVLPDDYLAASLQIPKNRRIIMIRRLLYTEGETVAYDIKYLIYHRGMPIIEKEIQYATFPEMVSKATSLFSLKKELAIYARLPDEELRRHLDLYTDQALLVVEQKFFNRDDRPVGLGITYFRGDYIKLRGISE